MYDGLFPIQSAQLLILLYVLLSTAGQDETTHILNENLFFKLASSVELLVGLLYVVPDLLEFLDTPLAHINHCLNLSSRLLI